MSSPATKVTAKSMNNSQTVSGTIQPAANPSTSIDNNNNNNNRRNAGNAATTAARYNQSNPRGNQSVKKNHVDRRKPNAQDYEYQEHMAQVDVDVLFFSFLRCLILQMLIAL